MASDARFSLKAEAGSQKAGPSGGEEKEKIPFHATKERPNCLASPEPQSAATISAASNFRSGKETRRTGPALLCLSLEALDLFFELGIYFRV